MNGWLSTLILAGLVSGSMLVGYLASVARRHIAAGDTGRLYVFLLTLSDYLSNSESPELKTVKRKTG